MIVGFDGSRVFASRRTGTENYSYSLLKALAKIDQQNTYIVYIRPGVDVGVGWPENFHFREIRWPRLWTQGGLSLQTFKDNLDVLFVPSHTLPIIKKPGLKTVITVHDLGSEYLPHMHQLKQRVYLSYMQRHQLSSATKIIAVSKATKDDLVKKIGIKPENVTVVYEGYNKDIFREVSARGRSSFGRSSLMPFFLFVGTIQPRKNLDRIIKAFSKIKNKNLVIVGGKGWLSDEIYNLPKKLGIEQRVKFLGYVSDEKLSALYFGAEALLFSSLFEGFGIPILEAQACGCPVITSNISSMPEVAGPPAGGGAVLVDPYSVDDIVKGMRKINNQETRNKVIKEGFENVKRFSWEKAAKETLKVLEEAAG